MTETETLTALWERCAPLLDLAQTFPIVSALRTLDIDPRALQALDLARVLPRHPSGPDHLPAELAAALREDRRLVLQVFDPSGALVGLLPVAHPAARAPSLPPGRVLACGLARCLLAGDDLAAWRAARSGEGGPDLIITADPGGFLAAATLRAQNLPAAVLGILPGAWIAGLAQRIPGGARIEIRTRPEQEAHGETMREALAA